MKKALYGITLSVAFTGLASASLIEDSGLLTFGTGLGAVPTILTIQATGRGTTENGCVAFIGGSDKTGAAACSGFVQAGSMVKGQTQTQLVSNAKLEDTFSGPIDSYANLALVLNISQTGAATPLTLTGLSMIITDPVSGAVFRSSGIFGSDCDGTTCTLTPASSGTGSAGVFVFTLDAKQQADAEKALGAFSTSLRVGAFMSASSAVGSPESVFLGAVPAPPSAIPEPATYALLGLGLLGLGFVGKPLRRN